MKKISLTKVFAGIALSTAMIFGLFSCTKSNVGESRTEKVMTKYDKDMYALATAINKASQNHPEFNALVKSEVLKKKTGDYEMPLKDVINTTVSTETKGGFKDISVGELIASYLPASVKSSGSLEEILEDYPDVQVSVPVHAEDMNTSVPSKIAIVPSYYRDLVTETVPGLDENGNDISVDAINEPDEPYMVLSLPEKPDSIRFDPSLPTIPLDSLQIEEIDTTPNPSIELTYINNSVRISFLMNIHNCEITKCEIHRAGPNSNVFTKIGEVTDFDLDFCDWTIENNKEYSYKAITYFMKDGEEHSNTSNIETIFIDTTTPQPVENLTVQTISGRRNQLRWNNNTSERYNTQIYRRTGDSDPVLIATLGPDEESYIDNSASPGIKSDYTVRKVNNINGYLSPSRYAYVYTPYRNPEGVSNIVLKKINANLNEVESWLYGNPEYYVTVYGVTSTGQTTQLGHIDIKFDSRSDSYNTSVLLYNWSYFDHSSYYPTINFHLMEYDVALLKGFTFSLQAKAGVKLANAISVEVVSNFSFSLPNTDKECGTNHILYFENPENRINFSLYNSYIEISETL